MNTTDYLTPLREVKTDLDKLVEIFECVDLVYLDLLYICREISDMSVKLQSIVAMNKTE